MSTPADAVSSRARRRRAAAKDSALTQAAGPEAKRALYHCNYCQKDISNTPRIRCAICPDFDLCLECFSVGVEITPHRNDHDYRVVDNLSFPLFDPDWGADEEILLLEAIDIYGLGVWATVAEHVGPTKTAAQCKEHYFAVYVDVPTCPLPMPTSAMLEFERQAKELKDAGLQPPSGPAGASAALPSTSKAGPDAAHQAAPVGTPGGAVEADAAPQAARPQPPHSAGPDEGTQPPLQAHPEEGSAPAPEATSAGQLNAAQGPGQGAPEVGDGASASAHPSVEQQVQVEAVAEKRRHRNPPAGAGAGAGAAGLNGSGKAASIAAHALAGGLSLHGEPRALGQRGGGASAVTAPSAAQPAPGGPSATPKQSTKEPSKPSQVQGDYAMGYHAKRQEFDPEYDQDAECLLADMEFSEADSPEDRALKLRVLEVYNMRLDERAARAAFLRDRGLLSMRKVQALERRRTNAERDTASRLRVFARYSTPAGHDDLVDGLILEQRLRARIQELKAYRRLGVRTLEEADILESEARKAKKQATQGAPDLLSAGVSEGVQGLGGPAILGALSGALPAGACGAGVPLSAAAATAPPPGGNKQAGPFLNVWRTHRGVPLDITCLPGVEVLNAREREACASLRLLPLHYLALKDMMLRDCQKHGTIARHEARTFFRLDPFRSMRLYDLWVGCGWVTGDKATAAMLRTAAAAAAATPATPQPPSRAEEDAGVKQEPAAECA